MVWQTLEAKLSTPRMSRYLKGHQGNQDHAAQAYVHNMRIAESLVSIFHVLEVALRNAIQREMVREYQRDDWFEEFDGSTNSDLVSSYAKVAEARTSLKKRGVTASADDITAELSFGFWTSLFNRKAFLDVSKPLMRVFHFAPKHSKKADVIRSRLNNARDLRNRCFHHEPLLWQPIFDLHRDITEIVQWIDPGLCTWLKAHDRLPGAVADWNNWKEAARRAAAKPATKGEATAQPVAEKADAAAQPAAAKESGAVQPAAISGGAVAQPASAKTEVDAKPKAAETAEVGEKAQAAPVDGAVTGDDQKAPAAKLEKKSRYNKPVVKISVKVKADVHQKQDASSAQQREPAKVRQVEIPPADEAAKEPQPQPTGEAGARPVLRLNRKK